MEHFPVKVCKVNNSKVAILRRSKGIRQEDLALYCGVDRSTVAKWETGKSTPRPAVLKKLAELFDCTIDELLD